MKKLLYISQMAFGSLMLSTLLLLTACSSKEENGVFPSEYLELTMTLTPSVIDNAEAKDASQIVKITSNTAWEATPNMTWIYVDKATGVANDELKITLDDNQSLQPRNGEVQLAYGDKTQTITITQKAATPTAFKEVKMLDVQRYSANITGYYQAMFTVTECGVLYSISNSNPTVDDNSDQVTKVTLETVPETGVIIQTLSGLKAGTNYYVRLYTISPLGTEYSEPITFTTDGGSPEESDNPTPGY